MTDVPQTEIEQTPVETETPILTVTPVALNKIRDLMAERDLSAYALRVCIQGGGCSGFSYGMAFDDQSYPGDANVEYDGVRLVVDSTSLTYLRGSEIDFVDSLMGGGFAIHNPNAVSTCGCGHSFRTSEEDPAAESHGGGCSCGSH